MKNAKPILFVFLAGAWISLSEFVRNQFLFKNLWETHYKDLGLTFPAAPVNGLVWGLWSLLFAVSIYFLMRRFTLFQTTLLAWLNGFVLMWFVTGNLAVLPYAILWAAVPLSFLEAFLAAWIIRHGLPGKLKG